MLSKITTHKITLCIIITLLLSACFSADDSAEPVAIELPSPAPQVIEQPQLAPITNPALQDRRTYLDRVNFVPSEAKFYALVTNEFALNAAELEKIGANGFVVSDRWTWDRFIAAYAWIYWKDLPVLVTIDSLLHTVHQSYDDLLKDLEYHLLIPTMRTILAQVATQLASEHQQNQNPNLDPIYADVQTFISTAQTLLDGGSEGQYIAAALAANSLLDVVLFGDSHPVDFTLFKPRGHYTGDPILENYFRAMTWLAQVDFRLLEYDMLTNEPILNPAQVAGAMILRDAIDKSGQRNSWTQFNAVFEALIGRSDNMTLFDLDRFVTDAALPDAASTLTADPAQLLNLLTKNDYGQQRITGQIIARDPSNSSNKPILRPVSFLLMGQRFAIDSYVTGNVVYDRVMANGEPVLRALPSPLDVMVALGNDRAITHLAPELAKYPYAGNLAAMRQQIDGASLDFWQSSVYNRWLGMLRSLNGATTDLNFPQSMRTTAWADKMLQTQLASWTQLRHDNILYVKQSFSTMSVTCEYPAGYVEPYPEFYAALYEYAQSNYTALAALPLSTPSNFSLNERVLPYFQRVMQVAETLRVMAEKELRLEEFDQREELFLRSIMVAKAVDVMGCGGPTFEDVWDGWYRGLFYQADDNAALIADVHTNPTNDSTNPLYPPRVLHAASGPIAPIFFTVDTDEGSALYVGPAFSYYELVTQGDESTPAARLNDEEWRNMLSQGAPYPTPPTWTASFRLPTDHYPEILSVPTTGVAKSNNAVTMPVSPVEQPFSPLQAP